MYTYKDHHFNQCPNVMLTNAPDNIVSCNTVKRYDGYQHHDWSLFCWSSLHCVNVCCNDGK